ncbi:RdgB/HAM1 family non-canonical purine NTP pyrophosphatase [bacterium]|nr:MAG: RdgB/HAM1 family non-canonical purine NTP pyrophosphatase [bacterium]
MKLAVATNNSHKIDEIRAIFNLYNLDNIELINQKELSIVSNPEETAKTLIGNAQIKSLALHKLCGLPTISDDTGLFVEALNGKPGVKSARFASENSDDKLNRKLLLDLMNGKENRNAYFETAIHYISGETENSFIGRCEGNICLEERGKNGFGYDPIFTPYGFEKTFAELPSEIKNTISHRYKALIKFTEWLKENN